MRRLWYIKYIVTLLASTALTFHLLHSKLDPENLLPSDPARITKKIDRYLIRKLTNATGLEGWVVLPGNVTVHEGNQPSPFKVSYRINADKICSTFDVSRRKLVIFVASRADHFARRKVIRETWGQKILQDAYNYRVVFVLGVVEDPGTEQRIIHEGYRYGDIVQIDLAESFRHLGRKSAAGLEWTRTYCGEAEFGMKTDDDILVHVPNLFAALNRSPNPDTLLLCHENRMRRILRKDLMDLPADYHKYEVSEVELPGEYYPPYCSGMAYLFSSAVRDRLLVASRATPVFFIEDVYLTGFCRHKAGILITPHPGITLRPPVAANQAAVCTFREGRITSQEVNEEELRLLWAELNTQGFFCPQFLGYVTPSVDRHSISSKFSKSHLQRLKDS